ncbi:hypothetical protein BACUNI_01686 [Bacteroides uniformis ATCC 8492]|uniref:Uncharacterized protein n=1 Tax=Bacteroides uniformis (strain ATCC 8492 / DSM 6597 / CCUG 4942 / CIP 103695 / JCM 5828 / KCTC 5204 / NCTC 13054 / VPI 0061) TaxID=411479 RepID=A0ABC9ND71_BACUC|nr:hypothetical protein BACUNI_01686 [Bacteroides uniformis ATCC 8492]
MIDKKRTIVFCGILLLGLIRDILKMEHPFFRKDLAQYF